VKLAIRVLIALVAGFAIGLAIAGSSSPAATTAIGVLTPVGTIFVNLIRMTVIPLVVSMLISSVGRMTSSERLGRIGARALVISIGLLTAASIGSLLIANTVFARIQIDRDAALALRGPSAAASPAAAPEAAPTVAQWFVDLVPQNVIRAAADGAILPVILFAVMFGLALAHVGDARRDAVLGVVNGIADAMQRLVGWILELAPIGVFALAVPLAFRLGISAAGAVIAYIALVVALTVAAVAILLYPLGILAGRMPASAFVSYCAPSQAIAFASRSSLAALPVMVQSAERARLPETISRVLIPLSASLFHFGAAVAQTVGVVFLARLFAIPLTTPQLASIVVAVILASFAVPGIPGGSIIAMVPVLAAADLPIEGVGILLAVDTIPDMFRTTANLTGTMTLAAILPAEPERRTSNLENRANA
jgi:Na+/H+-dicarboxylate symporter